ncbi:sulfotransferase family protein [Stella humosa]|uniref:Sulfotransferase family protein n=1 Tax=Stella humosa TaxID=94 RepID=A0A3N1KV31_9PROT|nr:sulfotransferase [Stella humosa]ROP84441.1 sulfotransferase family protein [Stella humosa]BBK33960.1 hypothetical protein STHU_45940 [Stella humosa]
MMPADPDDFPISDAEVVRRTTTEGPHNLFGETPAEMAQLDAWSRARPQRLAALPALFVLFIGYPRSGHSLTGALLDAHPEMAISHELDVLRFRKAGFSRDQILLLIAENSRRLGRLGRRWHPYDYSVPGAWQGRWDRLQVIGDKKGGETTRRLVLDPGALEAFERFIDLPVRFIHVVRHPADNIATMVRRSVEQPGKDHLFVSLNHYAALAAANARLLDRLGPERSITLWHEDFVAAPEEELARLCTFLGVGAPARYLSAAAGRVLPSARQSRREIDWPPERRQRLGGIIADTPFLRRYAESALDLGPEQP